FVPSPLVQAGRSRNAAITGDKLHSPTGDYNISRGVSQWSRPSSNVAELLLLLNRCILAATILCVP
ncbi:MAG: hypothetical protein ACYS14_04095, partial [Planctomycetota bacterium]